MGFTTHYLLFVRFFWSAIFLMAWQSTVAQEVTLISSNEPFVSIPIQNILILVDSTNSLTALEVVDSSRNRYWQPAENVVAQPNQTYWLKSSIRNESGVDLTWCAYPGKAFIKEMYDWDSLLVGNTNFQENGRMIPYARRSMQGFANYANPLLLTTLRGTVKTPLFKLYNPSSFYLQKRAILALESPNSFMLKRYFKNIYGAFVIGGLLIITIYHAFLFVFLRERMYLTFVGLLASSTLFFAYFHGFSIEFLWPKSNFWDVYCFIFILATNGILWVRFAQHYLQLNNLPKFWQVSSWIIQLAHLVPVMMVLPDFFMEIPYPNALSNAMLIQISLIFCTELFVLCLSFAGFFYKIQSSGIFLLANFIPLLAGVTMALQFLGVVPYQDWIAAFPQIGYLIMTVVFSFGLGKKMSNMKSEIAKKKLETEKLEREKETQRKKIIEQKNGELAQKIEERTSEVTQQKEEIEMQKRAIELQNVKLQELNQEKNNLINVVAHDLKSPLHQINGLMTILNHTIPNKSDEQSKLIGMVSGATSRLSQMVTSLLDINAIESGKTNLKLQKVELSSVLKEVEKEFAETAQEKRISISILESELCCVEADESYIHQVFENLLSNAIKFSPKGREISMSLQAKDGKTRFSITDSGPGLSDDDKTKLFKKFQKLSAQPTGNEHSTGLGLSIVKRFVEAMGGKVWCESEWGKGATFFVEFDSIAMELN